MADGIIQLSPDSTGKKVDTEELVVGANTVHRERMQIAGDSPTDIAPVTAADGLLVNLGANNDVTVAGGSTLAEQQAQTALLTTIDGDTGTLAGAVAGTEVQVDVVAALPAGNNNIGDVDIASLPNEGQQSMANSISVAIASDQSTVPVSLAAGGTTQYAEDTAHVSGDQVTMAGVVQQTADAALGADGDRSLLQVDSSGFLKVNIKAGAGSGGTAMADDAAFTPATTQGTPAFALADEVTPDTVDEGDAGALRMTLDRKLLTRVVGAADANRLDIDASGHAQVDIAATSVTVPVSAASLPLPTGAATSALQTQPGVDIGDVTINNAAGASAVNIQDGGNSITVDGTVGVSGTVDTELPAAAALGDATANPTTPLVGAANELFNGTTWDRMRGDITNGLDVDVTRLPSLVAGSANIGDVDVLTVPAPLSTTGGGTEATALRVTLANDSTGLVSVDDNGGSLTVDGTVTANQGTAGTAWEIVGDVASDVAVPANPVIIGGRASTAQPTAVSADGDSVNMWTTRRGAPVVTAAPHIGIFNGEPWTLTGETAQYTTTQTSAVLVAGGASERLVVTKVQIQVGGTTAGTLQLYFGTGAYSRGTNLAIFDGEFAPSATLKPGVIMDGPFISAANGDDLLVTTSAAINPLTITVWYYVVV